MLNLDPAKLLVIAVVAIILLGPDRLPQVARQVGAAWRTFNEFRHRMETEVRSSMPDLPPTHEIARLARSPSALLNKLSAMSEEGAPADGGGAADGSPPGDDGLSGDAPIAHQAPAAESNGGPPATSNATSNGQGDPADLDLAPLAPEPEPARAESAPPVPASVKPLARPSSSGVIEPGDPNLN